MQLEVETRREAEHRANEANAAKARFVANVSHEILTPLTAILGLSELIGLEAHGPLENELYAEYAGDIHTAGSHLLVLINDMLDLARIEADALTLEESGVELIAAVSRVHPGSAPVSTCDFR
ncbi:MAG: sensor histidine kinase [Acidimicrobiales bacterium]